jgi:hypothetical protein
LATIEESVALSAAPTLAIGTLEGGKRLLVRGRNLNVNEIRVRVIAIRGGKTTHTFEKRVLVSNGLYTALSIISVES